MTLDQPKKAQIAILQTIWIDQESFNANYWILQDAARSAKCNQYRSKLSNNRSLFEFS